MQKSTFAEIAQDIAAIQQRRFAEQAANLLAEVHAATTTINECPWEGTDAQCYIIGALRGMIAGMAGFSTTGTHPIHASCFDSETTEAFRQLVAAINEKA